MLAMHVEGKMCAYSYHSYSVISILHIHMQFLATTTYSYTT